MGELALKTLNPTIPITFSSIRDMTKKRKCKPTNPVYYEHEYLVIFKGNAHGT